MECSGVTGPRDILTKDQISHILDQAVRDGWKLVKTQIKPAAEGISGFVGDHFRVTLDVKVANCMRQVNLFIKCIPLANEPKAKAIDQSNFYRREMLMFELFEKMGVHTTETDDTKCWCSKAYICNDYMVVMPDLLHRGYRQLPPLDCLDLQHTLLTTTAIARFHAAFACYETRRILSGHLPFNKEYADLLTEPTFSDSPWLHAAAKLTSNLLAIYFDKSELFPADLEETLVKLYIEACDSLTESASLNVINHKDLWINNIMFKYEGDTPKSALLIDFQCIRYGPPAFDVMIFLYLNTSRNFREIYEKTVWNHYFVTFQENITEETRTRLHSLRYDFNDFETWCEKARMFGMLVPMAIFPYALMEASLAQKTFDDPTTFLKYCNEDRTEPVLAHARESAPYRLRQLEVCEEFVERYVCKKVSSTCTE